MIQDIRAGQADEDLEGETHRAGAWVTEVLDAIAALGRQFQDDLTPTATMSEVFAISRRVLRRVGAFETWRFCR